MRKKLAKIFLSFCLLFTLSFSFISPAFASVPSDMSPYDYIFFMTSFSCGVPLEGGTLRQVESLFDGYLELTNNTTMLNQVKAYKSLSWGNTAANVDKFASALYNWFSKASEFKTGTNVFNLPSKTLTSPSFGEDGVQFSKFSDVNTPTDTNYTYVFSDAWSSGNLYVRRNLYAPKGGEIIIVMGGGYTNGKRVFKFYQLDSSSSSGYKEIELKSIAISYIKSTGAINGKDTNFTSTLTQKASDIRFFINAPFKIFYSDSDAQKYAKNKESTYIPSGTFRIVYGWTVSGYSSDAQKNFSSVGSSLKLPSSQSVAITNGNNLLKNQTLSERVTNLKSVGLDVSYTVSYTVEYYKRSATYQGSTKLYSLAESENLIGVIGAKANISSKVYDGFSYEKTSPSDLIITENGQKFSVYYDWNSYNYKVEHYKQNVDGTYTKADTDNLSGFYSCACSYSEKSYTGFSYNFRKTTSTDTIIPSNNNSVVKLYYDRNNYIYKVEHYKQNVDGTYTKADTDNLSGIFGSTASFSQKTYTGFTYQSSKTTPADKTISSDNNLVIKLYYDRDSHSYTVEHYLQDKDGQGWIKKKVESLTGLFGADASFTATNYVGFTFAESLTEPENRIIPAADNLVIKLYYLRNLVSYSVEHYKQQYEPSGSFTWIFVDTDLLSGLFETESIFTPKEFSGFSFDSSLTESKNIPASDEDLIVKLYYKRNPVEYTIEHYTQSAIKNVDGSSSWKLMEREVLTGFPGCLAACPKKNYSGFFHDSSLTMPKNPIIPEDNSLTVKLYYTQDLFGFLKDPVDTSGGKIIAIAVSLFIVPFIGFFLIRLFRRILSIGA